MSMSIFGLVLLVTTALDDGDIRFKRTRKYMFFIRFTYYTGTTSGILNTIA